MRRYVWIGLLMAVVVANPAFPQESGEGKGKRNAQAALPLPSRRQHEVWIAEMETLSRVLHSSEFSGSESPVGVVSREFIENSGNLQIRFMPSGARLGTSWAAVLGRKNRQIVHPQRSSPLRFASGSSEVCSGSGS